MAGIIEKVMPILLFILIGYLLKVGKYRDSSFFIGLQKLVFDFSLPCLLFISFLNMELRAEYIGLTFCVMFFLVFLNLFGRVLNRIKPISSQALPHLLSGTAFGLLGFPLYVTVFGIDKLPYLAILAVGHELFIWIIWRTMLRMDYTGKKMDVVVLKSMMSSPLVIAIFLGLICNLAGFSRHFTENGILAGVYQTMIHFSQLSTPLILLIVGHDLVFDRKYTGRTVLYTLIRRLCFLGFGSLMTFIVLPRIMEMSIYHYYALFTFLILPPPFAFSTFIEAVGGPREQGILGNNVVVLDTLVCVITFTAFILFTGIRGA